jgi:hypothetical protein
MRFTKKLLLPRIQKQKNNKLEKFIVSNVNKEINNPENKDEHFDFIQMQYFFESAFFDIHKGTIQRILNEQKNRG